MVSPKQSEAEELRDTMDQDIVVVAVVGDAADAIAHYSHSLADKAVAHQADTEDRSTGEQT